MEYIFINYHIFNNDMYKEWFNVKWMTKTFLFAVIMKIIWVVTFQFKEVDMMNSKQEGEFKEATKKYIMNRMRDYS